MSQRAEKVESLTQALVARALAEILERDAANVTVTRVDVAPDLRNANVWVGLLGTPEQQDRLWGRIQGIRGMIQVGMKDKFTMKFVPQIHFKRDTGGEYAANIDRLLKEL